MTSPILRPGVPRAAVFGAFAAVLVIGAALGIQHLRHGWPFSLHHDVGSSGQSKANAAPTVGQAVVSRAVVELAPDRFDSAGITLTVARIESIAPTIRAVATVAPDESRVAHLHTRVAGWLEQVYVSNTGQSVRAGEPIAGIFSQELYASQIEYLSARRQARNGPRSVVVEGARSRLKVLGLNDADIAQIERSGEARRLVTLHAPRSGVVLRRTAAVGTAVDPSTEIVTIADLSQVWVLAEVADSEAAWLRVGAPARLDFGTSGRQPIDAAVEFIYPTLSERTRSLRVRFVVPNPDGALRPGVYGTAELAAAAREMVTVPRDAVVDSGERQHVFVQTTPGRFEPRTVKLGERLPDRVEIREGLAAGEAVVASGVFLIDSESRLRASGSGAGHAGHGAGRNDDASPSLPAAPPHGGH